MMEEKFPFGAAMNIFLGFFFDEIWEEIRMKLLEIEKFYTFFHL